MYTIYSPEIKYYTIEQKGTALYPPFLYYQSHRLNRLVITFVTETQRSERFNQWFYMINIPVELITQNDNGNSFRYQSVKGGVVSMPPSVMVNDFFIV